MLYICFFLTIGAVKIRLFIDMGRQIRILELF